MSKFKAGDKVIRQRLACQFGFVAGKVYTVESAIGSWLKIAGERGYDAHDAHDRHPFHESYFDLAPYSRYFTEQATKAEPTTGHAAGSPIQKHSKGEFYPMCVVVYSDIGRMAYTIENLEQGTVLGFMPGEFKGGSNIRAWGNAAGAYKFLAEQASDVAKSEWIKGRPTFIKHSYGLEIMVPPKHKRWLVTLGKVDLSADVMLINGVYYKALEQDIG